MRVYPSMKRKAVNPSHQLRALTYKAWAFQRRQLFSNICCVLLCPALMVLVSGGIGIVLNTLVQSSVGSPQDLLLCSNSPSAFDALNQPILNYSDPRISTITGTSIPGSTSSNVFLVAYFLYVYLSTSGPPGAATSSFKHYCTHWMGPDYPKTDIYSQVTNSTPPYPIFGVKDTSISSFPFLDTLYTSEPLYGWWPSLLSPFANIDSISYFSQNQLRPISIYAIDPAVNTSSIGILTESAPFDLTLLANSPKSFLTAINSTNLLDTVAPRYWINASFSLSPEKNVTISVSSIQKVPSFIYINGGQYQLDDLIGDSIITAISKIALVPKTNASTATAASIIQYNQAVSASLSTLYYGALYFQDVDHEKKYYKWTLQYGTDTRLKSTSNFPAPGIRLLQEQSILDQAILRKGNATYYGGATITQGFRSFPQIVNTGLKLQFGGIIGGILYPFGVSFLLPIFVIALVREREERILIMMKMNGIKPLAYYASHYITFFIQFILSTFMFMAFGLISKLNLTFFTVTSKGVYILLFFVWGHVQIAMAFFFATIFKSSRVAQVMIFLIVLCSVIVSLAIQNIFGSDTAPIYYFIWPPFAFYRALQVINLASYSNDAIPYTISKLKEGDEVYNALWFMFAEWCLFLFGAWYSDAVTPSEFGLNRPWNFPILDLIKWYEKRFTKHYETAKSAIEQAVAIQIDEAETMFEDDDVRNERTRILEAAYDPNSPLIMKNMRKVYNGRGGLGPKVAVKDVSFAVEEGIIFGLLGPNGAGKTTLINILTGLYASTGGTASLAGFDIKTQSGLVYQNIGVCPQFDILWDDLSVSDHLYFYARLKGIPKKDERQCVLDSLAKVALQNFEFRQAKGLSGGEKRRLSIAIALVGKPVVVFLDEPTTGLDPEVRRLIWDIINNSREGKTIVLTTHSMEEAEALCQRIGIMAKGTLRCLGNQVVLKEKYGSGFRLFFNAYEEDVDRAAKFIESQLPDSSRKVDTFATNISYEFQVQPGLIPSLFKSIEAGKAQFGILDWGLGQTTLEDVFVRLISESDANAD